MKKKIFWELANTFLVYLQKIPQWTVEKVTCYKDGTKNGLEKFIT